MDTQTGQLYASYDEAILAGATNVVMLKGLPEDIEAVSQAVSAQYRATRKAKNKAAKRSRRTNRKG